MVTDGGVKTGEALKDMMGLDQEAMEEVDKGLFSCRAIWSDLLFRYGQISRLYFDLIYHINHGHTHF